VSLSYTTRRQPRYAAVALLLTLHAVVVALFMTIKATRELPGEGMVTLMLAALPKKSAPTPPAAAAPPKATKPARTPTLTPAAPATPALPAAQPTLPAPTTAAPEGSGTITLGAAGNGATGNAGPASGARLNLAIPKEFFTKPPPLTPAQEAKLDPRSNRLVLTKREQIDIDFGLYECVAWVRQPDGTIYRGPGHLQRVQDVGTNPFTYHEQGKEDRHQECVK